MNKKLNYSLRILREEPLYNINIMDTTNESWVEQLIYINETTSGLFNECFHIK